MEQLLFTSRKNTRNRAKVLEDGFTAFLLALAVFLYIKDSFDFPYSLWDWWKGGFTGGLIKTWNLFADALGKADYLLLPHFAGESQNNELFLSIGFLFLLSLSFLILRYGHTGILLLFAIAAGGIPVVFHLIVSPHTLWFFLFAVCFTVFRIQGGERNFGGDLLFLFSIGIIFSLVMAFPVTEKFIQRPAFLQHMQEKTETAGKALYYGENPLKSGDLTQRKRDKSSGATALEIQMEKPHSMYLRGFIGDLYTGKEWKPLGNGTYYRYVNSFKWLEEDDFNALGQLGQAKERSGFEEDEGEIKVKAVKADKRYAYIPYEIKAFENPENFIVKGGNFAGPKGCGRNSAYAYQAEDNTVKLWTDVAGRLFTEPLQGKDEEKREQYFIDESYYNEYVYAEFTYLSPSDQRLIEKNLGDRGDQSKGHIDYKYAIETIRKYLAENILYTETLGAGKEGLSMLQEFFSFKKGYDVQYAAAGTLMFRYYGIPARYAEGYLVTPEDVRGIKPEEKFSVGRNRAHAWVEIYIDGLGFVPIEVCPEYTGIMEEADMRKGLSNEALHHRFTPSEYGGIKDEKNSSGGDDRRHPEWKWLLLLLLPLFLLLAVLLCCICRLCRKLWALYQRKRLFVKGSPKLAISAMYDYMEERGYPLSLQGIALGNKAAYSRESLSEEERKVMLSELKSGKKQRKKRHKL